MRCETYDPPWVLSGSRSDCLDSHCPCIENGTKKERPILFCFVIGVVELNFLICEGRNEEGEKGKGCGLLGGKPERKPRERNLYIKDTSPLGTNRSFPVVCRWI